MKEGWNYIKLEECCKELFAGGDVPKPDVSKNKTNHFSVPIYTNGVENEGLYGYTIKSRVSEPAVTISARGTIGATFRRYNPFFPAIRLITAVPKKDLLSIDYLFYALKTLTVGNSGTSIPQLTIPNIKNVVLPIPPLSEQQSIVDYFDSAFAKIDAMKANAEKALNEAKALFQASLKEMLEPKEGWEEKKLGDVGTFVRGGNFTKKDFVENGFPCIHYGQIHTTLGVATYRHLSCVPKSIVKAERCASKGDLVIAITSEDDEGSCKCTAWMSDYDAYVGGHTAIYKHHLNPIYVSYYFKAPRFQKAKLEYTHGFKVVEISPKDIAKIPISYPTLSEQQSIVNSLDTIKSKVDQLQANFNKISQECDALKQAILRQVFE